MTIDNVAITDSNRGFAFMVFDGGYVSDVVISNITIQCRRFDWFWWGDADPIHFNVKRRSEVDGVARRNEPAAGAIRNVLIRNVIARGKGTSLIQGHPQSWLDGISLENIKLFLSGDPASPLQKATHALQVRWAKNLKLKDVEVNWQQPDIEKWQSALSAEDVKDLEISGFAGRQAPLGADIPAIVLNRVQNAIIRDSKAPEGTSVMLRVTGEASRALSLFGNDFRAARVAYRIDPGVNAREITLSNNFLPEGNGR